jgi:hypothetical protein
MSQQAPALSDDYISDGTKLLPLVMTTLVIYWLAGWPSISRDAGSALYSPLLGQPDGHAEWGVRVFEHTYRFVPSSILACFTPDSTPDLHLIYT